MGFRGEGGGMTFEEAMAQLEEIVRLLESGELGLEESLERFHLGMRLVRFCTQKLDEAEKRIDVLVEREDGRFELAPMAVEEAGEGA